MLMVVLLGLGLGVIIARTFPVFALVPVALTILLLAPLVGFFTSSLVFAVTTVIAVEVGYFVGSIFWTHAMRGKNQLAPEVFSFASSPAPSHRKPFGER